MLKDTRFKFLRTTNEVIRVADDVTIGDLWKSRDGYMIKPVGGTREEVYYVSRPVAAGILSQRFDAFNPITIEVMTPECMVCGMRDNIRVDAEAHARWKAGEVIQVAFPEMSRDDREMLKTGTHGECWANTFGDDE